MRATVLRSNWFLVNDLLLNPTKLEVIAVGSATQHRTTISAGTVAVAGAPPSSAALPSVRVRWQSLEHCHPAPHYHQCGYGGSRWSTATQRRTTISAGTVTVAGAPLTFVDNIRSLGVQIDSHLSFDAQVNAVCKSCNHHIRALRQIRNNLSTDTAKTVACAIICSRLDYCNSLLHNISKKNIQKLQRIQNNLARVVLKAPRLTSPESMLASLHWLPVVYRIQYKLLSLLSKL